MASTADRLTAAARDLLLQYPHLGPSGAYAEALRRDPGLALAHHHGEAGAAPRRVEPDTADPATLLQQHAARHRVSFAEACRARPELFQAWNRAERVRQAPGPVPAGLEPGRATARPHFSTLSEPRRSAELRRMGVDEPIRLGRTYVAKLSCAAAGGGMFEVVA